MRPPHHHTTYIDAGVRDADIGKAKPVPPPPPPHHSCCTPTPRPRSSSSQATYQHEGEASRRVGPAAGLAEAGAAPRTCPPSRWPSMVCCMSCCHHVHAHVHAHAHAHVRPSSIQHLASSGPRPMTHYSRLNGSARYCRHHAEWLCNRPHLHNVHVITSVAPKAGKDSDGARYIV
jgi:hypothetical protein